jgi:hypothetical protein
MGQTRSLAGPNRVPDYPESPDSAWEQMETPERQPHGFIPARTVADTRLCAEMRRGRRRETDPGARAAEPGHTHRHSASRLAGRAGRAAAERKGRSPPAPSPGTLPAPL